MEVKTLDQFFIPSTKKEYDREWKRKHPDKVAKYAREYYSKHRERVREYYLKHKEYAREYYLKHKQRIGERTREYQLKHKQKTREYQREYQLEHRQKLNENARKWRREHPEYSSRYLETHREHRRQQREEYRQRLRENYPEKYEEMKKKARERTRRSRQNEQVREKEALQHKIWSHTDKAKATARRRYKRLMEKAALLIGKNCAICGTYDKVIFHERNGVYHYHGFRYDNHVERFIPLCQRHHKMIHSLIAFTKLTLTEQTKIYELLPHSIEMPIKNVVPPTSPSLQR